MTMCKIFHHFSTSGFTFMTALLCESTTDFNLDVQNLGERVLITPSTFHKWNLHPGTHRNGEFNVGIWVVHDLN